MMKTIRISEEKCNGCGLCVEACHEGALSIENNKAKMTKGWLCDGLGSCLPACPNNAIEFYETDEIQSPFLSPGSVQWPIQLELISEYNPLFQNKELLIAADCSAFTNNSFFDTKIPKIIACPKLGKVDEDKLKNIFTKNEITSVTVVRMEVPCCAPLYEKVKKSISGSSKNIPVNLLIVTKDGKIKKEV